MNNTIYRNKLLCTFRVNRSSRRVVDRNIVIDSRNDETVAMGSSVQKEKNCTIKIFSRRDGLITMCFIIGSSLIP